MSRCIGSTFRSARSLVVLLLLVLTVVSGVHSETPVVQTNPTNKQPAAAEDYPTLPGNDPIADDPLPDAEPMPLGRPNPEGVEYLGPSYPSSINPGMEEWALDGIELGQEIGENEYRISPAPPDAIQVAETDSDADPRAFGALSMETRPWAFPRRVGVKLIMTFGASSSACSGTLIDPMHVLTAAHCMYPPGTGAWPNSIRVVPGYRVIGGGYYAPYGTADWTNVFYYTGWTNSVQANIANNNAPIAWDDDIVVVRLDRPIGALTSWFQYGTAGNCSFYQNNQHHSAGYPGGQFESPLGTCNRGRQQFYWRGFFDSCDTNWLGNWTGDEIRFNTESWNGQSGSGMYYINPQNNRVAMAVLSNGTCSGNNATCPTPNCGNPTASPYTNCVRISNSVFNSITNYINSALPGAPDLIPLLTRVSDKCITSCTPPAPEQPADPNCQRFCPIPQVPQGRPLPFLDFYVHNYSSANFAGQVTGRYYLSTDRTITGADTQIGTFTVNTNLTPKQSTQVNEVNQIVIPANTAPGRYYVGIVLTNPNANAANDTSSTQDVAELRVVSSGACCKNDGTCVPNRTLAECSAPGDNYQGNGTSCVPYPCGPSGACCDPATGTCDIRTQPACIAAGRNFQGDGTTCNPNPCPQPPMGACCDLLGSGLCHITIAAYCQGGQQYMGDNTTCDPNPCTTQPSGACCDRRDGTCTIKTGMQCAQDPMHLVYLGDGQSCLPNFCPMEGGACCDGRGRCTMKLAEECVGPESIFFGVGITCDPNPCPPAPAGACCAGDGSCSLLEEEPCISSGGFFGGPFTPCDPNPCFPLPTGACCDQYVGACTVEYQHICEQAGGNYQGDGTDCMTNPCPIIPTGACCDVTGGCLEVSQALCELFFGNYQGDGSSCTPDPCPDPTLGACCDSTGGCTVVREADCAAINGVYAGDGTDCLANPCLLLPVGSCCDIDGGCSVIAEGFCLATGGTYLGDGTDCISNPCPVLATGACCNTSGFCSIRTQPSCEFVSGAYRGDGSNCQDAPCPCGDFDHNLIVDGADFSLLLLAFSACDGISDRGIGPAYNAAVDMDFDGCITFVDYQLWLQCYRAFSNNLSAPPPVPSDVGDLNADRIINGADIQPFVTVMISPSSAGFRDQFVCDFNADGHCDQFDLKAIVELLIDTPSGSEGEK